MAIATLVTRRPIILNVLLKRREKELLIDIQRLRKLNRDACRECWGNLRSENPNEVFYGYGLYTISDPAGPIPSASSESEFRQRAGIQADAAGEESWFQSLLGTSKFGVNEETLCDERWDMPNWEHAAYYPDPFYPSCDLIESAERELPQDDKERGALIDDLKAGILAAMVAAVYDLRRDGFFADHSVTLFCSVHDSYDTFWLERESARILNSPRVFRRFRRERLRHIKDPDSIVESMRENEIVPPFRLHLKSCGVI